MKALVEYVAKSLAERPEAVQVREIRQKDRIVLELHVAKEDMGRIIGRNGRVANALRTLLRVVAEREGYPVTLDVVEP